MKINKLDQVVNRTECFYFSLPISVFQEFLRKKVSSASKCRCCFTRMTESYIWINLLIDFDILLCVHRQFLHKTTGNDEFYQNESNFIKTNQKLFPINFYFVLFESLHILSLNFIG